MPGGLRLVDPAAPPPAAEVEPAPATAPDAGLLSPVRAGTPSRR